MMRCTWIVDRRRRAVKAARRIGGCRRVARERRALARANEFAATTTRSPPSRTVGRRAEASTCRAPGWEGMARMRAQSPGPRTRPVPPERDRILPSPRGTSGEGPGEGPLADAARTPSHRDRILPFLPRSGGEGPGEGPPAGAVRCLPSCLDSTHEKAGTASAIPAPSYPVPSYPYPRTALSPTGPSRRRRPSSACRRGRRAGSRGAARTSARSPWCSPRAAAERGR